MRSAAPAVPTSRICATTSPRRTVLSQVHPRVARLVHRWHVACGTDMHQRKGDLRTAQDACEPCRHLHGGVRARHLIDGDKYASQCHSTIVERNKPCRVLWQEQGHRPCAACYRFRHRPVQPACHPGTLMRREHDQMGRVRLEI
jgi:hypothetical protein